MSRTALVWLSVPDTIRARALNRATLARQLLLRRADLPPIDAIEHLVGMQAQAPLAPYVGLWSRLGSFRHTELADLVTGRQAVRIHLMRTTVHLVSARDAVTLGPLLRPVHERAFATGSPFGRRLAGLDLTELVAEGQRLLGERPRSRAELGRELAGRWPRHDPLDLAYAVSYLLAVVQIPPRGVWGQPQGSARWALAEMWLGRPFDPRPRIEEMIRRYLGAFGPATVNDIQAWSGLTRLREITSVMAPRLRLARDESGAELLDLPGAPRPDPDTPAPVRFLPEYDNLLLSYADRGRVIPGGRPVPLPPGNGGRTGTVLIDGRWNGIWAISRSRDTTVLRVEPQDPITGRDADELEAEGARLLSFAVPGPGTARCEVRR
jgi:Winged helix DNA-binding domain